MSGRKKGNIHHLAFSPGPLTCLASLCYLHVEIMQQLTLAFSKNLKISGKMGESNANLAANLAAKVMVEVYWGND